MSAHGCLNSSGKNDDWRRWFKTNTDTEILAPSTSSQQFNTSVIKVGALLKMRDPLFKKHLLFTYHVPGTVVDPWETDDQDSVLAQWIESSMKSGTCDHLCHPWLPALSSVPIIRRCPMPAWVDEWMNGRMGGWVNGYVDGWVGGCVCGWINGGMSSSSSEPNGPPSQRAESTEAGILWLGSLPSSEALPLFDLEQADLPLWFSFAHL